MSTLSVSDLPRFGRRLRRRREEIRLTPTLAAKRAGISLASLCNIEDGRNLPSLPVYQNLCHVLRISPGKLLA